jgi:hypothetical protein
VNIKIGFKMIKIDRLRDATRCNFFPSAEMVVSMSREFGAPLTAEEIESKMRKLTKKIYLHFGECIIDFSEFKATDSNDSHDKYSKVTNDQSYFEVHIPHTSKAWTPIDNFNADFMQNKMNSVDKNFIKKNLDEVQAMSEKIK